MFLRAAAKRDARGFRYNTVVLARRARIGSRDRISHIFKKGRCLRGAFFQIRFLPNAVKRMRFSLLLPSKIAATAVERNRLRRRVYEAIRLTLPTGHKACYDVAVLVSPKAMKGNFRALQADLRRLYTSLSL